MANEQQAATVEVQDDAVVTVDIDIPGLDNQEALPPFKEVKDAVTDAKEKQLRTRTKTTDDEASAALTQAIQTAENAAAEEKRRREAAEATAQSERNARAVAEQAAQVAAQEAKGYREQAEGSELAATVTGIESAQREIASAQEEYQRAQEAADFPKTSAAQVKIAKAAAALDRLETKKAELEAGLRKAPAHEGRVEAPPPLQPSSSFEAYVSQYPPRPQAWLRAHPEFLPESITDGRGNVIRLGGDTAKNKLMMKGHPAALGQGYEANSDDYFRVIEETVGMREPAAPAKSPTSKAAETETAGEQRPAPKQRQAQPSAPVSREVPSASGQPQPGRRTVSLSKEQQDAAKISFPHLTTQKAFAEYAKNLLELEAEGKLGRTTH